MKEPKIRFSHVTKIFETRTQAITAVKDYSMDIQEGEFVAILGPSGCGKSTLIRMLDGIIDTTEGDIFIDGEKVNFPGKKMPQSTLRRMGFIFQQPNMLPWFTVRENVPKQNKKKLYKIPRQLKAKERQRYELNYQKAEDRLHRRSSLLENDKIYDTDNSYRPSSAML